MRHFTKEELDFVKELMNNEIPYNRFVKTILHCDGRSFHRMCIENGFKYPLFRKRFVNKNPFLDLSNSNVMYWLGWLATDGTISHKETRISLGLSIKDIDVLEKFRDFVSPKLNIKHTIHHDKFEMCIVSFRNKEITDYLYTLGFKTDKTHTFVPKFNITWDYIRGVFEGDGYFRWGNTCEINIISACKKHIEIIKEFTDKYDINSYIREKIDQCGNIMYNYEIYTKSHITKFIDYIYANAETFMNRKFSLARIASNSDWKALKLGEPALGIPNQASIDNKSIVEGVTT